MMSKESYQNMMEDYSKIYPALKNDDQKSD